MKEIDILSKIYKIFNYKNSEIVIGAGDDCAVVNFGGRYFIITTDDMVDGIHFISDFLKPHEIASRLVRINVSDVYAMGDATPLYSVLTAGLKKNISNRWIDDFIEGLRIELDYFGIKNIGGNLTRSPVMFFNMTLIGNVKKNRLLKRRGAKQGDYICILGNTGFSFVAVDVMRRKKRVFINEIEKKIISLFSKPPLFENLRKDISLFATSMIDNSDGIYKTIKIISSENSLKAIVDAELIYKTVDSNVDRYISDKKRAIHASLVSDDYNPVFTISSKGFNILSKIIPAIRKIGYLEKGNGVEVLNYDKKIRSFEHF